MAHPSLRAEKQFLLNKDILKLHTIKQILVVALRVDAIATCTAECHETKIISRKIMCSYLGGCVIKHIRASDHGGAAAASPEDLPRSGRRSYHAQEPARI